MIIFHVVDILSEETLLLWADSRMASTTDTLRKELFMEPMVQEFVTWLRESAEESDDDDDDEEEEDEEDDD